MEAPKKRKEESIYLNFFDKNFEWAEFQSVQNVLRVGGPSRKIRHMQKISEKLDIRKGLVANKKKDQGIGKGDSRSLEKKPDGGG